VTSHIPSSVKSADGANEEKELRFSVIMPVYNRKQYLRQAIDSVFAQTFTSYELIVVDDGSEDGAMEVLESYVGRIKILQQPRQGPEAARNKAAVVADGEYLIFLDSDDFLFPDALAAYDQVIRNFHSPPLVLGTMLFFRDGEACPQAGTKPTPVQAFKFQNYLSKTRSLGDATRSANGMGSIVIRTSVYHGVGGMRNSNAQNFHVEDTHLLLKVGNHGPCIFIDEPATYAYRQHDGNSTKNAKAIADGILRLAYAERRREYPGGKRRDRYAIIGGRAAHWSYRYCWRRGHKKLALELLFGTADMVVVALCTKLLKSKKGSAHPILVPEVQPELQRV
jgi:glycosyltransferase involved in cell wall biosynthesis